MERSEDNGVSVKTFRERNMEALRVEGLSKKFGQLKALEDVNLSLQVGEHRGIIGPNGAGKTTLFKLICGELPVTSGRIYMLGQHVTYMPEYRRVRLGLSHSFQLIKLFLELSVVSNVLLALVCRLRGVNLYRPLSAYTELWNEAEDLLTPWSLWEKRYIPVEELAYGEQRQMELILSLATRPKLWLLDEPFSGMTPAETAIIVNMIGSLGKDISMIIISHDMDLMFSLDLDRITVLHYGQIIAEGSQQEIKVNPRVREIYLG